MRRPAPVAVCISDLHLSLLQPYCRMDKDWLKTQAWYLSQVTQLKLPVLCAGDVFDRWNPPPELIHFALRYLPTGMIAVPGQHDLPNHRIDQMRRSGYGVLEAAGKIVSLHKGHSIKVGPFHIQGFGWEEELRPPRKSNSIALLHRYLWTGVHCYQGAPQTAHLERFRENLQGYVAAISGDNHIPFQDDLDGTLVFNCGAFMRRRLDEMYLIPRLGILHEDGKIISHPLNTQVDRFAEIDSDPTRGVDISKFVKELEQLDTHELDFREVVIRCLRKKKVRAGVREAVLACLEGK